MNKQAFKPKAFVEKKDIVFTTPESKRILVPVAVHTQNTVEKVKREVETISISGNKLLASLKFVFNKFWPKKAPETAPIVLTETELETTFFQDIQAFLKWLYSVMCDKFLREAIMQHVLLFILLAKICGFKEWKDYKMFLRAVWYDQESVPGSGYELIKVTLFAQALGVLAFGQPMLTAFRILFRVLALGYAFCEVWDAYYALLLEAVRRQQYSYAFPNN